MNTIRNKLWTFIMLIVAAVLLMVWIFQVLLLEDYYIRKQASNFQKSAEQVAAMFEEEGYPKYPADQARQNLFMFTISSNCLTALVAPDGTLLWRLTNESGNDPGLNQSQTFDLLFPVLWQKMSTGQSFLYTAQRGTRWTMNNPIAVAVGEPFTGSDGGKYYLCLVAFMEPIQNTVWLLRRQLTLITMISIGIATLLVFWLARYITDPVLEITRAADRIAGGDYDTRVKHKGDDEIGVLADTMNNMAQKLGQNERMQRDFIANTSHELKTPISAIRANAELIMDMATQNEEERRQFLQIIVDESIRLNHMVEDILDLSAMESGREPLRDDFDVCEMLQDVADRMSAIADDKGVSIFVDTDGERFVNADPQMMFRVFYNLVDNAVKYTPTGGHVVVRSKSIPTGTRVEIQDDGVGIASEDLVYIWDRFYKVDKARSRAGSRSSSSGLGLAIVKSILDAHGFAFGMESELDRGTLVWVEMNRSQGPAADKTGKSTN